MRRTKTIAVAMSGGVDSTFAAALLLEHGFEVIGLTAEMLGDIQSDPPTEERIRRAVEAARRLGIRHHILDVRPIFHKKVVEPFVHAYLTGHTPNPCVLCNREIKFGILLDEALKHGAEYFATGHYARLRRGSDGKMCLLRARDRSRDQSYFLARLTASELERCIFPLGERAKRDVVREVVERGLAVPGQSESREICFVSDPHPGEWITRTFSPKKSLGDILDTSGRKVGEHHGIHHFTVGQRKGLRLALGRPVYVVSIDAVRNTIVVGSRQEAMSQEMMVEDLLWLCGRVPNVPTPLFTQIRYNHDPALSLLIPSEDGTALVKFDSPQFAITPGQLAVFYREEEVIGSAWIRSVVRS